MPPKRTRSNKSKGEKNTAIDENRIHPPCSFSSRLKSFHKVHMFNGEPITYQTHAPVSLVPAGIRQTNKEKLFTRSESTKNIQSNVVQLYSPQWLAQLGFYYTPISIKHKFAITCAHCNTLMQDPIPAEVDICDIHFSHNSSCPSSLIWKFRNMKENTDSTIWRKDPYFGDVNNSLGVNIRKESFKYWKYTYPDIDQMVSSGLYYDPLNDKDENTGDDRVVCMYCGLNLEQWEENDNPVDAHKQSNPNCWVFTFQDNDEEITKPIRSSNAVQDEIPNFEPYEENPFTDNEDNFNDDELNKTEENRHSIESTTTTTNVMPIEIVDKDEVEEYLSNSQQFPEKMVEIPSIKSSELSQYFTELDAGSEYDLGASYFASNKKKRDKEREEREQITKNVETISEEVEVVIPAENNEEIIQNNPPTEVAQDENELYENYQFDDFEIPDHNQNRDQATNTNEEIMTAVNNTITNEPNDTPAIPQDSSIDKQNQVDDSQHNISTSYLVNGSVNVELEPSKNEEMAHNEVSNREDDNLQEEAVIDELAQQGVSDVREKNNKQDVTPNLEDKEQEEVIVEEKEKEQNEVANGQKKKEDEERQKEIDRVEKLEAELKFLKEQIAALQKSQESTTKEDRVADEITPISINESNFVTEEVQVKIEDECESETFAIKKEKKEVEKKEVEKKEVEKRGVAKKKTRDKKKKKLKRMHEDENLLIRKSKKARTVITEEDDKMEIDVPITENAEPVAKEPEKELEVKIEEDNEDERGLHNISSSVIEPISLFRSDMDSLVEPTYNSKINSANLTSPAEVNGMENATNEIVTEMQESKNEESFEIRHDEKGDIMITPIQHLDNSPIKVPLSSPVKQPRESHKETIFSVPSFGKSMNEANESEIPTQADEYRPTFDKTDFHETGQVEGNEDYHPQKSSMQVYGPHDTTHGNSKDDIDNTSPTLLRKNARSTPEEEETADLRDLIKNDIRGKPLALSPKGDKSKGEIATTEKLFLGSDFLMDNQSTPHLVKVENFLKDTTKANHDATPKISLPVLSQETKEWQPLDGKKYLEFLKDIQEATSYVKEVIDSPYELLGEDMDGLLTEFVAEIPPHQLRMTIRERLKFQEDLAVRLVLDKADEMLELFREDQQRALQFLENLPEPEE